LSPRRSKKGPFIAGLAILIFLVGAMFPLPDRPAHLAHRVVIYGIGCIIFLRFNGMEIR